MSIVKTVRMSTVPQGWWVCGEVKIVVPHRWQKGKVPGLIKQIFCKWFTAWHYEPNEKADDDYQEEFVRACKAADQ